MKIEFTIPPSGNCPVQAEGTVNGLPFYFRARGIYWKLSIATHEDGDPLDYRNSSVFTEEYQGRHYEPDCPYCAGWADEDECMEFIQRAAAVLME